MTLHIRDFMWYSQDTLIGHTIHPNSPAKNYHQWPRKFSPIPPITTYKFPLNLLQVPKSHLSKHTSPFPQAPSPSSTHNTKPAHPYHTPSRISPKVPINIYPRLWFDSGTHMGYTKGWMQCVRWTMGVLLHVWIFACSPTMGFAAGLGWIGEVAELEALLGCYICVEAHSSSGTRR